uniref:Uncharacterized protein n=1 Tax=Erpetoichthys calabaricus TaxID=27687 RepID=A0A8C4SXF7_ERPCA
MAPVHCRFHKDSNTQPNLLTMAEAKCVVSSDQFICSVCLEVLKNPATIPCGHNYCMRCIKSYWDDSHFYSCPQCRMRFSKRPLLHRNVTLSAIIDSLHETKCVSLPPQTFRRICPEHNTPVDLFCLTDDKYVCFKCVTTEHKDHETVPAEKARAEKQVGRLWEFCIRNWDHVVILVSCRHIIFKHLRAYKLIIGEKQGYKEIFTSLLQSVESLQSEVTELIRSHEQKEILNAEAQIVQLEKETEELKRREAELVELSQTDDHIHFLQLTLDPKTAHRCLTLSEGNKKATWGAGTQSPNCQERFDCWPQVLCKEALSGSHCYWEVEWSGRRATIGVAYKGIARKGEGDECVLGCNNKSWCIRICSSTYSVCHNNTVTEIAAQSSRVGVYLDYQAGFLSFYALTDRITHLHTINHKFTEPLYPGFGIAETVNIIA